MAEENHMIRFVIGEALLIALILFLGFIAFPYILERVG